MMAMCKLFLGDFLAVYGAPTVDDVGEDEGHQEGDIEHGAEGELAAAGVLHGERTLEIGSGGVVGSVVPSSAEQQCKDGKHGADASGPDAVVQLRVEG